MSKRKPKKVIVPISDWHWFTPSGGWDDVWDLVRRIKKAGVTVRLQRSDKNYTDARYVAAFYTQEEAALFKLTYM